MQDFEAEDFDAAEALALAEQAEAEAAEAEALAAAARARAKAIRLRRQVEGSGTADEPDAPAVAVPVTEKRARRLPAWPIALAWATAWLLIVAVLATGGWLWFQHRGVITERDRKAQFTAAASQGVVSMTTLDFNRASQDVQRILDNSTGEFKKELQNQVDDFTKIVQDSKVVTVGTVKSTAVESMSEDSAVVLVAATSEVTNAAGAKNAPRQWRLSVTVTRDESRLKMSKVEFVP